MHPLSKTNSNATVWTTVLHTIDWGIAGVVIYFIWCAFSGGVPDHWPFTLSAWSLLLGFVGGLIEWQVDDGVDDSDA